MALGPTHDDGDGNWMSRRLILRLAKMDPLVTLNGAIGTHTVSVET